MKTNRAKDGAGIMGGHAGNTGLMRQVHRQRKGPKRLVGWSKDKNPRRSFSPGAFDVFCEGRYLVNNRVIRPLAAGFSHAVTHDQPFDPCANLHGGTIQNVAAQQRLGQLIL